MRFPRLLALSFVATLAAACAPYQAPAPTATLPPDAVQGAGDPQRAALALASNAFAAPRRLSGQPVVAAHAIASMEYLTVDLPQNPRVLAGVGAIVPQLTQARTEWRSTLGIAPDAPPQLVINQLFAAARALQGGQQEAAVQALSNPAFTRGGPATLALLSDLPPLPRTNAAAVNVSQQLQSNDGMGLGRR